MRGITFSDTYSLGPRWGMGSSLGGGMGGSLGGGMGSSLGGSSGAEKLLLPIARLILDNHEIPYRAITGDVLKGYDIKAQDSVAMLRLSILSEALKESTDIAEGPGIIPEIYCNAEGIASLVTGKENAGAYYEGMTLLNTSTSQDYITRVDHVLVKGQDPLPTRYTKNSIDVMGYGIVQSFSTVCAAMIPTKNEALKSEAWAEFETSPQSKGTRELLRRAVKRSEWEQLVGYKMRITGIPPYASFSLSQTTPRQQEYSATEGLDIPIQFSTEEGSGEIVDIGGVSILGAQVLDIVNGLDLFSSFGAYLSDPTIYPGFNFNFTANEFYILLNDKCGLMGMSRGENWFLIAGPDSIAGSIKIRPSSADWSTWKALRGSVEITQHFFRRTNGFINSMGDLIKKDISEGNAPLSWFEHTNANLRGNMLVGYGGDKGIEAEKIIVAYTIAKPSIQIRSTKGDALNIAYDVARGGVNYVPIVIRDIPAPTGYFGIIEPPNCNAGARTCLQGGGDTSGAFYPPAPADEESEEGGVEVIDIDSPLDELYGSVIDLTTPFLGGQEVMNLAKNIHTLVNDPIAGKSKSYSYAGVARYCVLPGMNFNNDEIVQTVEILYNDKDSITTNITTGPKYYPIGSYSDSQYVKRSETITRNGRVITGSNAEGTFIVHVDGRGNFEAISQVLDPIFPGDKVEVKILNVPVEKD